LVSRVLSVRIEIDDKINPSASNLQLSCADVLFFLARIPLGLSRGLLQGSFALLLARGAMAGGGWLKKAKMLRLPQRFFKRGNFGPDSRKGECDDINPLSTGKINDNTNVYKTN